jgi:HK97 family phage major capsid protein
VATYNTGVFRGNGGASPDALVPQPFVAQVIKELPKASTLLNQARRITMSSSTTRQPVLSVLPQAYWVSGDNGLKQTTTEQWKNVNLVAEELAALVPVPNAYLDDSGIPIWDEIRPSLVEAIGSAFDSAGLFGVNKPASWTSDDLYTAATAAGNTVTPGGTDDIGVDVANLGVMLARDGFAANGFAVAPGFSWNLVGFRSSQGVPVYQPNPVDEGPGGKLYGYNLDEVLNGAWDATKASMIAADWTKVIVGVRQDITFTMHEDGIISDDAGNVVYNAMQQDSTIMRVVFRGAFATANPVTRLQADETARAPFAVLGPIAALS